MRVLIYGGRDFVATENHWQWLDYTMARELMDIEPVVVSGKARGADSFGEQWADSLGFIVDGYPADWEKFDKGAGPIRNQQMLDSGIDLAIQFPGGTGTADMRRRLDKAGVRVIEYKET